MAALLEQGRSASLRRLEDMVAPRRGEHLDEVEAQVAAISLAGRPPDRSQGRRVAADPRDDAGGRLCRGRSCPTASSHAARRRGSRSSAPWSGPPALDNPSTTSLLHITHAARSPQSNETCDGEWPRIWRRRGRPSMVLKRPAVMGLPRLDGRQARESRAGRVSDGVRVGAGRAALHRPPGVHAGAPWPSSRVASTTPSAIGPGLAWRRGRRSSSAPVTRGAGSTTPWCCAARRPGWPSCPTSATCRRCRGGLAGDSATPGCGGCACPATPSSTKRSSPPSRRSLPCPPTSATSG